MKKIINLILLVLIIPTFVYAEGELENIEIAESINSINTKTEIVKLGNCVNSEGAVFSDLQDNPINVKFLGIKILEDKIDVVDDYICTLLTDAKEIKIEYDITEDKDTETTYDLSAWVFLDNVLLQDSLVKVGYADLSFSATRYSYYEELASNLNYAKENYLGIWQEETEEIIDKANKEIDKKKKSFIQKLFDDVMASIVSFIDNIVESILNFIEEML